MCCRCWHHTAQKVKFSIKDFFGKCDQIRSFLQIWSHVLKKSLIENIIFSAVSVTHATIKIQREEKRKSMISGNFFFDFQIFETFRSVEICFSTTLNKCFRTVISISEVSLLLCQNVDTF